MAFIYRADIWCDDCGQAIRNRLTTEGLAPANPENEWSYDSDDFPKRADDDEESDLPQHCAAGENCINAIEIDGGKVGLLFGELTSDGVAYVEDAITDTNDEDATWSESSPPHAWCRALIGLWYQHYRDKGYQFKVTPNWI